MAGKKNTGGGPKGRGGERNLSVKVRTARGRKLSSTRWLQRQLNDPYVAAAKRDGYRSRAAYKLLEIDDKYHLLKPGMTVLDLGAAPGGWTQIAVERVKSAKTEQASGKAGHGHVIGIDLLEIDPIIGSILLEKDFMDDDAPQMLMAAIEESHGGKKLEDQRCVDLVMSDMAASSTGHKQTDHLRIMGLCEVALDFAEKVLRENGAFLAKVLQGGTQNDLLNLMKRNFKTVRHVKPKASRADSSELYVLATGFHL